MFCHLADPIIQSNLQRKLGLSAMLKGTLAFCFYLVGSEIQTNNLSVTCPTILTTRLPAAPVV